LAKTVEKTTLKLVDVPQPRKGRREGAGIPSFAAQMHVGQSTNEYLATGNPRESGRPHLLMAAGRGESPLRLVERAAKLSRG
jgi:hypothetical protein